MKGTLWAALLTTMSVAVSQPASAQQSRPLIEQANRMFHWFIGDGYTTIQVAGYDWEPVVGTAELPQRAPCTLQIRLTSRSTNETYVLNIGMNQMHSPVAQTGSLVSAPGRLDLRFVNEYVAARAAYELEVMRVLCRASRLQP